MAFLRAVNVGGTQLLPMAALREALAAAGYDPVRTLLQSGNVVLGAARTGGRLEAELEAVLHRKWGIETPVVVRSGEAWRRMIAGNPFPKEAVANPAKLQTVVLKALAGAAQLKALRAAIRGPETVELSATGRELHVFYPEGAGNSKLTGNVMEKALGCVGTSRNWNTVLKLAALAEG